MQRCFDLARQGIGYVSPNPPVGAVLVHNDTIIGEGYHHQFGGHHAEVDAFNSVPSHQRHLIPESTLYVSLEPCCVTGKTPPCTDRIILEGVRDVRISVLDPNPSVAGKGIELLKQNGIDVSYNILPEEGEHLIRSFKTNILQKRPHVILKWAQSKFNIMGIDGQQVWLSHPYTRTWSHRLRAEADAILVGSRTVETDDPELTTRAFPGRSPQRVIYDPGGRLTEGFKVFSQNDVRVHYFSKNEVQHLPSHLTREIIQGDEHAKEILNSLFNKNIGIVLVEGGARTLQMFIDANLWDEAWIIQTQHPLNEGIRAPNVRGRLIEKFIVETDTVVGIKNTGLLSPSKG